MKGEKGGYPPVWYSTYLPTSLNVAQQGIINLDSGSFCIARFVNEPLEGYKAHDT